MLHFLTKLYESDSWRLVFNLLNYVTFRAAAAAMTAFAVTLIVGPGVIRRLKALNLLERTEKGDSEQLDEMHRDKSSTPTMGGLMVLAALVVSVLLWSKWIGTDNAGRWTWNPYVVGALLTYVSFALLGFWDDWFKLSGGKGISLGRKLLAQAAISAGAVIFLSSHGDSVYATKLLLPFLKPSVFAPDLYGFFALWGFLVIVGSCNGVNITDGLDGLASGCVAMAALTYGALAYFASHMKFADYLQIAPVPGSEELVIFCAALSGAALGFLWFNAHPAEIFMGDTGALPMGGAIGFVALAVKQEVLLVLVGGVFVVEAMSVLLQVLSFRLLGRRIFSIAPLHHHYQFEGLSETKIVVRFWIVAAILGFLALATLKIR